jgi:DNA polymerase III epsilon subunit-like protein
MLDLETLGTRPGSVILTIGAVRFDENGTYESFYKGISIDDSKKHDLKVCPNAHAWWLDQTKEALDTAFSGTAKLDDALNGFCEWVASLGVSEWRDVNVWGNGSDFDNALLAEAYAVVGMRQPWSFTGNRCYRTMKNMFQGIEVPSVGVQHNALDDAIYQADHLIAICKHHNLGLA